MVATNNIQGQINALTKISRITGQDYSAQINSLAEARTNKINSANEEFTQRYNQAIAQGDIEGANQILAEQQKWLESVNAPQELPTLEGQYQQEQQNLQIAYEKKYLDGIDQITEAIVQLTGNILNFQYNPYADTALQIAQGYAVGRVKETMNSTGMYFSSMTTSAITKAVAELVPVYEQMAKDEMKNNLSMLQSTANYLMNLEQMQFNMWKSQIELQFEANNDRRKEVAAAWDRVNNIGYVDNQASAILGVAAGTLSPNAREHLQSLQEEIAKENRNLIQNMVLADYKNELEIDRMNEQAKLDVWKYNQQQATAYKYNSQLKKEQFTYDLALANAKNNKTTTTGITQLCFQLAVNATLPEDRGGLDSDVIIIDSENTFRPERIVQMANYLGLDPDSTLSRIHVARAFNSQHQILLVDKAMELAKEKKVRLLIVDSLTSHFRAEYVGRGTLAERQQVLNRHMHDLLNFATLNNAVIVVTNQVAAKPDAFFGDPTRPIGGHIVGHTSTFRIYLRKGKSGKRVARLVDSPNLPEGEAVFMITEDGVKD